MKINLNKCKAGDKLRSKHGIILTYVEKLPVDNGHTVFPHRVQYPNDNEFKGSFGTRTDDGHVFNNPEKRLDTDHDIVEIIKEKPLKLSKKNKVIPTMTLITVVEVIDGCVQIPTAFYGNNETKVVEAAETHFAAILKEIDPPLEDGSTFDEFLQQCLDNGFYDNENGHEVVMNWPSRVKVNDDGSVDTTVE